MRTTIAAVLALVSGLVWLAVAEFIFVTAAFAWDIDSMNTQIEQTNVIVGGICSGTIIDKANRLVLTAHHCIMDQLKEVEEKKIDDKTGEITIKKIMKRIPLTIAVRKVHDYQVVSVSEHLTKIVGDNAEADVALLQVVDTDFVPMMAAPLAPDSFKYKRGLKVFAVGNPGIEFDNSITEGIISAPERKIDFGTGGGDIPLFQLSAGVIGGNSGGAIYNDAGEMIGTVTGGIQGSSVSFSVPISYTKEMIRKAGFGPKYAEHAGDR